MLEKIELLMFSKMFSGLGGLPPTGNTKSWRNPCCDAKNVPYWAPLCEEICMKI